MRVHRSHTGGREERLIYKEISAFEFSTLKRGKGKNDLHDCHFAELKALQRRLPNSYFKFGRDEVRLAHYVGRINTPHLSLEILPKLSKNSARARAYWRQVLHELLAYTYFQRGKIPLPTALGNWQGPLLEGYLLEFLTEMEGIIRKGTWQAYRQRQGALPAIKGRILFNEQLVKGPLAVDRVVCQYQELTLDHEVHAYLQSGLQAVVQLTSERPYGHRARGLLRSWPLVTCPCPSPGQLPNLIRSIDPRRMGAYKKALQLAYMILSLSSPRWPDGDVLASSFLIDMNRLFEDFLFKLTKETLEVEGYKVSRRQLEFWEGKVLRPDILIEGGEQTVILDAKWKALGNQGPADEDLRQIFSYNHLFRAPVSFLVYPAEQSKAGPDPFSFSSQSTLEGRFKSPLIGPHGEIMEHYCRVYLLRPALDKKGRLNFQVLREQIRDMMAQATRNNFQTHLSSTSSAGSGSV